MGSEIKRLGETLAAICMLADWPLEELSAKTGIPRHRLRAIENGRPMTKTEYLAIRVVIEEAICSSDEGSVFPAAVRLLLNDHDTLGEASDMKKFVVDSLIAVAATGATVNSGMTDGLKRLYEGIPANKLRKENKKEPYKWVHSLDEVKDKGAVAPEEMIESIPRDYEGIRKVLSDLDLNNVNIDGAAEVLSADKISESDNTICKHIFEDVIDFWQAKKVPKDATNALAELKLVLEHIKPPRTKELLTLAILCGDVFHDSLIASGKGKLNYFYPKIKTAYKKYTAIEK